MSALELAQKLQEKFGELISAPKEFRGEITVTISDAEKIVDVCAFAKKELGFDYLVDLSSVDNYGNDPRWTLAYELYGYGHRAHLKFLLRMLWYRGRLFRQREQCEIWYDGRR